MEEERIKEVREVSEADRAKQTRVLLAEAEAEEIKVRQVKQAEAEELSAKFKAQEIITLAQAKLDSAQKEADAKIKLAEGIKAEESAHGIAQAVIQEAKAVALEKEGLAKANVIKATGEAEADARLKAGQAKAVSDREIGMANADVTREQFKAEADGLVDKFNAMGSMNDSAREHEEYRMALETALKEALVSIEAGKEIAKENALVLSTALERAKIDIVGGEDHFFNNFAKSLSIGKAIDGLADKSTTLNTIIQQVMASKMAKMVNDNDSQQKSES